MYVPTSPFSPSQEEIKLIIDNNGRLCMNCLQEKGSRCSIHAPPLSTLNDVMAKVADHLVEIGLATRINENTIKLF